MPTIATRDGIEIFYKDWGSGQPIVFSHGWPLSADDWDPQMLFFLGQGFRVIAHDRRGHGRSTQTADGHDMDHYADDLAALTEKSEPQRRDSRRPFDRRRRGRPLHRAPRREPGRQGGDHFGGAPAHGQDGGQSGRAAERGVRRTAGAARGQSRAVLLRPAGRSVLRVQPPRREAFAGRDLELVAAGHDGRGQGALRRDRRLFPDGLHRGPEVDRRAGAGHAQRRRSDRPLCGRRARCRRSS